MGYCYEASGSGRGRLCCDRCGNAGGVRKRTCPYKMLGSTHRSVDGRRHALPYCYPTALCSPCLTEIGGSKVLHADCRGRAAERQAEADAEQARLDAGELLVGSAFGDWHDRVPTGMVGVLFFGENGDQVDVLVPDHRYHPGKRPWLSDYPEAVPWKEAA